MRNRNIILSLCTLLSALLIPIHPVAQNVKWSVDFNTIFDNREGDNAYTDTKTFFQTQLSPEIGLSLMDGLHTISGGAVWTQPIGSEWDGHKISPTLYYRYNSSSWKFSFGMFPRTQLLRAMPNYIWNDSSYYCQRNIRGALVQYTHTNGYFEGIVDWRGMQSETQREAFNIIARGEWNKPGKIFIVGGLAMMNHLAKTKDAPDDQFIVDNFIVNPYVGANLKSLLPLDSITVKAGALMSLTRYRADGNWESPCGLWLDIAAEYKWLGVQNTLYAGGKGLYPYYSIFNSVLDQGEPYYQSKFYNRTSVYAYILRNSFMNLEASLDFNFAKDNFTFYQRLMLRVFIDDKLWSRRKALPKSEYIRNVY